MTRTPRMLARLDGVLSGPADGGAADVALRYVRANLAALGLDEADLATLRPPRVTSADGVRQVRWTQAVDGIPAADSELRVTLDRDGRVLSVLGSPAHGLSADTTPRLSAGEAVRAVQGDVAAFRPMAPVSGPSGARRETRYADGTTAALALYTGRLAWRVTYRAASDAVYDVLVDARSGAILRRANLVKFAAVARVYALHPGGAARDVDFEAMGWLAPGTGTLNGRYVHVSSDLDGDDGTPGEEITRNPQASFVYAFQARPGEGCTDAKPCAWDEANPQINRLQNGAQAFYLANTFRDHLADAPIGFALGDQLLLETFNGSRRNNANMTVPPAPPVMQVYLWGTPYRRINSGDDAAIVFHEYTHAMNNRFVTHPNGDAALFTNQGWAIDEGTADWYAMDYLVERSLRVDGPGIGDLPMGEYTDLQPDTVRAQPIDCTVNAPAAGCRAPAAGAGSGGFTYGDFGFINFDAQEPHANGEIWGQTLWDLRRALIAKLGPAQGVTAARSLVTGALRTAPAEPTYLQMRDAILLSDRAAGGSNQAEIWAVFANRGMGYRASTAGPNDIDPIQDFTTPPVDPQPTPTPVPTTVIMPTPTPTPTVSPPPVAKPTFALPSSGKGLVRVRVTCAAACTVQVKLTVDAKTAKKLKLRGSKTVGNVRRTLGAGTATITLRLNLKARRQFARVRLKSFKARLTVTGGGASARRQVTIKR